MNAKIVIVDVINKRFVQREAEDGAVYLTKDVFKAQLYTSPAKAKLEAERFIDTLFIASEGPQGTGIWRAGEYKQITGTQLVPCKIEASFKFIPINYD